MEKVVYLDFETTGLNYGKDFPTEVAIRKVNNKTGEVKDYTSLIKLPRGVKINDFITNLTGLTTDKVNEEGRHKEDVKKDLQNIIDDETLVVMHNASFDLGFLAYHFDIHPKYFMCTLVISQELDPYNSSSLNKVYNRLIGKKEQTHRAMGDVEMLEDVFKYYLKNEKGILGEFTNTLADINGRELLYIPENAYIMV